jgi:hypothetical protein
MTCGLHGNVGCTVPVDVHATYAFSPDATG